jgi:hypothetical protein
MIIGTFKSLIRYVWETDFFVMASSLTAKAVRAIITVPPRVNGLLTNPDKMFILIITAFYPGVLMNTCYSSVFFI